MTSLICLSRDPDWHGTAGAWQQIRFRAVSSLETKGRRRLRRFANFGTGHPRSSKHEYPPTTKRPLINDASDSARASPLKPRLEILYSFAPAFLSNSATTKL